ncbi:MAG: tetratricopeptide repeat protein [Thermoanaerobaculales bacterium]|nr:tetratricopeptide repeat protein [Thermoanaerobaculales bacterium]
MKRRNLGRLIVISVIALSIEAIGAVGAWSWNRNARLLRSHPTEGARALSESSLLALPSAVHRARRLMTTELLSADESAVKQALSVLSERQVRWQPADPDGLLNRARFHLLDGQLEAGRRDLEDALIRDPTRPFSLRLLGLIARYQGRFMEGLEFFAEAEAVAPGYRIPPVELTVADEEWVRMEGLQRRLEAYPRIRVVTLIALGSEYRRQGKNEDAWSVLMQAAGDPRVDLVRARWLLQEGNPAESAGLAQGLAGRQELPSSLRASAWSLLAESLDVQGDRNGALAAAQAALRLNPESAAPYRALARLAQGRGDVEGALVHLRRAWGLEPTNLGVLAELARIAEAAGKPADARLALERAMELQSGDPAAAGRLVDFYLRNGAYMEAALLLSGSLDKFPADAGLLRRAERLSREVNGLSGGG